MDFRTIIKSERGIALIQVLFVSSLAATLAGALILMNSNLVKQTAELNRSTNIDLMGKQIATVLRSSSACLNTFGTTGSFVGTEQTYNVDVTEIRNMDNEVMFQTCATPPSFSNFTPGDSANAGYACAITTRGGTQMFFKDIILDNLDPDSSVGTPTEARTARLSLIFESSRSEREGATYNAADSATYSSVQARVTFPLTVVLDGAGNILRCVYRDDSPYEAFCESLNGELDDIDDLLCKSLGIGHPPDTDFSDWGLSLLGNLNVQRNMWANRVNVGFDPGDPFFSATPGRLSVQGNAFVGGGQVIGASPAAGQSNVGDATIERGIWLGAAESAIPVGDVRTQSDRRIVSRERLELPNFDINADLSGDPDRVVTTGWVRQTLANTVAPVGTDIAGIFGDLATAAFGDDSQAESTLLREFCNRTRIRHLNAANNNYQYATNGGTGLCNFDTRHLQTKCDAHGNCATVFASEICLDGICKSTWPIVQSNGDCSTAYSFTSYHKDGTPVTPYTTYVCASDRVIVGNNCCRFRAL